MLWDHARWPTSPASSSRTTRTASPSGATAAAARSSATPTLYRDLMDETHLAAALAYVALNPVRAR